MAKALWEFRPRELLKLASGITALAPTEFPPAEALALCFPRWGIETHYEDWQYKFEVDNFSGQTPLVIRQDFHARILMSYLVAVAAQEAQADVQEHLTASDH